MPSTDNSFQCGPTTSYTWSQQTRDNPTGLTPACAGKRIPESVSPVITTTYDIDCNKLPAAVELESSVNKQLSQQNCVKQGTCIFTVTSQSNCKNSRRRATGTMVVKVTLTPVGYNDTEKSYLGSLSEQDAEQHLAKLNAIEQILQDFENNAAKYFTVTINGVNYIGQIQSIDPTISCQTGSGYVEGFCVDCPAGSYSPGNSSCLYCDKGFYQDQPKSSSCVACPSGTTTSGKGSYSPNHCTTNPISLADIYPAMIKPSTKENKANTAKHEEGNITTIIAAVTASMTFLLVLGIISFFVIKKYGSAISKTGPQDYIDLNMETARSVKG